MPPRISRQLNNSESALLLAAEINGLTNPFVGIDFEIDYTQVFQFNGLLAEVNTSETPPGDYQFLVFGVEDMQLTPQDSMQSIFARQGDSFYKVQADLRFETTHYRVSDLFPFKNIRPSAKRFTFFAGVLGTFAQNVEVGLTVYGEILNPNSEDFPFKYR